MSRINSAVVDVGPSGGSSVHRPVIEDPHRHQRNFSLSPVVMLTGTIHKLHKHFGKVGGGSKIRHFDYRVWEEGGLDTKEFTSRLDTTQSQLE